jgi:hypothetical protein
MKMWHWVTTCAVLLLLSLAASIGFYLLGIWLGAKIAKAVF